MPRFDINKYDTVDARLSRFWDEHPNGAVHTELITDGNTITTFLAIRASVWFDRADPIPAGQGIAYGQADADGRSVDATSWVENCDTSAVGRALANAGYKAKKDSPRPSREEMETVTDPRRMEPNERQQVDAQHERNTAPPPPRQPEPSRISAVRSHPAPGETAPLGPWQPPADVKDTAHLAAILNQHYGWKITPDAKLITLIDAIHSEYQRDGDDLIPFDTDREGKQTRYPSTVWRWVKERATPAQQ